jgi:hypothetical protein
MTMISALIFAAIVLLFAIYRGHAVSFGIHLEPRKQRKD